MRVVFDDQQHGIVRAAGGRGRPGSCSTTCSATRTAESPRAEAKYLGGAVGSAALSTADTLTTDGPT